MKRGWKLKGAGFAIVIDKASRLVVRFSMLTLDPNVLNMNAYFMTELWERGTGKGGELKTTCAFGAVTHRDAQVLSQKKVSRILCACVIMSVCGFIS